MSPDGRILYHVDTLGGLIHACDVGEDGTLGRVAANSSGSRRTKAIPTGRRSTARAACGSACSCGWQARRYSPQGELLETVRFPVSNITKLAFGGDDLRTVYATTAQLHLKPDDLARQPQAGHLFAFRADVAGVPVTPVAL